MKPLSPEAKRALGALSAQEPSASDEARVRQNLERALGVVLPVAVVGASTVATSATASTSAVSASTASFTTLGVGAKATLFVAALSVGSLATLAVRSATTPVAIPVAAPVASQAPIAPRAPEPAVVVVEPPTPTPEPVVEVAAPTPEPVVVARAKPAVKPPAPVAKLSEEPEPTPEPVPEPTPPPAVPAAPTLATAQTSSDFATVVELQFPTCDAAAELRTAVAARALLTEDRASHALLLLGAYQRQCVSGQWSDEAWRVRLSSLCKLNRNKEATTLFEWFTSEYPKRRQAIESELRLTCAPSVLGE